jgi:hypothetical protein
VSAYAYAYAACGMILAGCAAYAFSGPLSAAILRARWAWRCRGHPALPGHETIPAPERS